MFVAVAVATVVLFLSSLSGCCFVVVVAAGVVAVVASVAVVGVAFVVLFVVATSVGKELEISVLIRQEVRQTVLTR